MKITRVLTLATVVAAAALLSSTAEADGPIYSLDRMAGHPYAFTPAYGHASLNPGSPRWFVPGYGYAIPGFGGAAVPAFSSTSTVYYRSGATYGRGYGLARTGVVGSHYGPVYSFGSRRSGFGWSSVHPFSSYAYGGPWYFPGATTNLQTGSLLDEVWLP